MPRKVREIEAEYLRNGFRIVKRAGKGSHRKFQRALLPGSFILSGQSGDDAQEYQERKLREALSALRAAQRDEHWGMAMNILAKRYSILIEWSDTDGIYVATMGELNGVQTHGVTRAEALSNAEEVIALYLDGEDTPPAPRLFDRHYAAEGQPIALAD